MVQGWYNMVQHGTRISDRQLESTVNVPFIHTMRQCGRKRTVLRCAQLSCVRFDPDEVSSLTFSSSTCAALSHCGHRWRTHSALLVQHCRSMQPSCHALQPCACHAIATAAFAPVHRLHPNGQQRRACASCGTERYSQGTPKVLPRSCGAPAHRRGKVSPSASFRSPQSSCARRRRAAEHR